jgi:hypothetical protein
MRRGNNAFAVLLAVVAALPGSRALEFAGQPTNLPCSTSTIANCGPWGYCDGSVGRCICAPGLQGDDCRKAHFAPCRLHPDGEMACNTFTGLLSCDCRQACERRHGSKSRWPHGLCWRYADGAAANTSDVPDDLSRVEFRSTQWPPLGKCGRPDPPKSCQSGKRTLRRVRERILGGTPVPNRHCPLACSHRGTCLRADVPNRPKEAVERYPLQTLANRPSGRVGCICHAGYTGAGCEVSDPSQCFNACAGHGACVGRFCLCDRGWQGVDCSLRAAAPIVADGGWRSPTRAALEQAGLGARRYAPTFVYPLPSDVTLEFVYQRDLARRGQYYANLMYLEALLARQDSVVADPEEAALFFVPVATMQMAGNLWHPYDFLASTVHRLQHEYPYWNRSGGRDHVFFLTTDRGSCWKPWALQPAMVVSYLGFPASEAYFGFEERLRWPRQGPNGRNNAYDTRKNSPAMGLDCYRPAQDSVVPVDALIGASEEEKLPKPAAPYACNTARKKLMFMGGSMQNMGRREYSQGVRQAIKEQHSNESGFVLGGQFTLDDLRDSLFCLAPSGWGWGWRLTLCVITQSIPVIIQPNVTQPFEELLPYESFSLRYEKEDIPRLPQLLRAVPKETICRMQRALAAHYRALLWQTPWGVGHPSAYDLTQVLLCRRAKALRRALVAEGKHPAAYLARHDVECPESLAAASISFPPNPVRKT